MANIKTAWSVAVAIVVAGVGFVLISRLPTGQAQQAGPAWRFHLVEATIDDVHRAIREGQITCRGLVQAYLNRAKAYNGVSNALVTKDGAPIPPAPGVVRAGAPISFPTATVAVSAVLPNFDQYVGRPIEFGRMEPTASDPSVQQQYGMTVGLPNAGRGPANHNSDALILPHKALIGFVGGAIGSDIYNDRAGIHCRTLPDAAKVLDALKDPVNGYYDPRDVFTTIPRSSVLDKPYASVAATPGTAGALKGMRIGIVRESMLTFPGVKADEPIVAGAAKEIKAILGKHLGATLVESVDPRWPDDPGIENMKPSYTQALAELLPVFFPDILYRVTPAGKPQFPEFAATIKPTEFAPGKTFGSGSMAPIDYLVNLASERIAAPA